MPRLFVLTIDVQLLCGGGLSETKEYLAAATSPDAAAALSCLVDCEAAGDFDDFTPQARLESYRQYYDV